MQTEVGCGQSVLDCLGKFAHNGPFLRTSQTSLPGMEGDGLSEFSGTFPRSDMMQNGTVYSLSSLVCPHIETEFGYVPTPRARMWRKWWSRLDYHSNLEEWGPRHFPELAGKWIRAEWVELLMGYPTKHTDLNN